MARAQPLDPRPRPNRGVPSNAPPRTREREREPPGRFEAKRLKGGVMSGQHPARPTPLPHSAPHHSPPWAPPLPLSLFLLVLLPSLFFFTSLFLSYGRPFPFLCTAALCWPPPCATTTPHRWPVAAPKPHASYPTAPTLGISHRDTRRGVAVCGDDVALSM